MHADTVILHGVVMTRETIAHTLLCLREITAAVSLLTIIGMMTFCGGLFLVIEHTSKAYVRTICARKKFLFVRTQISICVFTVKELATSPEF
jgi:hypothetical protein